MSLPPLAAYPALRLRRLRQADWSRRLVRESVLTPADLIWSMVVHEGEGRIPVASMPGIERLSVKEAAKAAVEARDLGIPAIAIFPHIDGANKDADGSRFLLCPMPGLVKAIAVKVGQEVKTGEQLCLVEAMKMENVLTAERDATVKAILCKEGDSLAVDAVIMEFV